MPVDFGSPCLLITAALMMQRIDVTLPNLLSAQSANALSNRTVTGELLQRRISREKLARKEAERILEQKSLELYNANTALIEAHAALEKQVRALKVERDRVLTMSRTDFLTFSPRMASNMASGSTG